MPQALEKASTDAIEQRKTERCVPILPVRHLR
jgi:hypothetical protein